MPETHSTPQNGHREIGRRLRMARKARGLTIEQLAARADLTKSFISRLERDDTSASVASLVRLCDVLAIKVGALFEESESALVRQGHAPPINFGGHGVRDYLFTRNSEPRLQVIESHVEPGGGGGDEPYALTTDVEFVYVLSGELEVEVGATRHLLRQGDGLTFPGREPHTWRNRSDEQSATALWVLTPAP